MIYYKVCSQKRIMMIKKICYILPTYDIKTCGIRNYGLSLAEELNKLDLNISLIAEKNPLSWFNFVLFEKPEIVHLHFEYQFISKERLEIFNRQLKNLNIPFIITMHTYNPDVYNINRVFLDQNIILIVHQKQVVDEFIKLEKQKENVFYQIMGCKVRDFDLIDRNIIRAGFGINEETFLISFFGSFYFHKGIDWLIRNFSILNETIENLELFIYSSIPFNRDKNDSYIRQCFHLYNQLGDSIKSRIKIFTDYSNEKIAVQKLSCSDVIVLPYKNYGGIGGSAAARFCMMANVPIIVSNAHFFDDIRNCIRTFDFSTNKNFSKFVDYIQLLKKDENYRNEQVRTIQKFVTDNSFENLAKETLKIYEQCIEKK